MFLNSQWLHIFWITDEFVVESNESQATVLPAWLAYAAILIDYLELPVIADTVRKTVVALRGARLEELLSDEGVVAASDRSSTTMRWVVSTRRR